MKGCQSQLLQTVLQEELKISKNKIRGNKISPSPNETCHCTKIKQKTKPALPFHLAV